MREGRKRCSVKRHRNVYTRGGSGSRNPFSCTVTRTRLSRVLEDWFSSGAFVILSSTSSSQNFLVPRTPAREKDKEDRPSGACLHPWRDFRAARVLAERLTFAFSEWGTAGESRRRSTKCHRSSTTANAKVSPSPSLFHDFLTGQTTQSVLSRSGQTPCIETSRGALGRERRRRPSNCHENVRTNVFDREKILTTSLNNLVRGCKVMGYVFSRVYKKIGFSWSRKINVGRRYYKDIV